MPDIVRDYLDAHPFHHETTERWPIQGQMRLRLSLASTLPPKHVSSSVLAIVLDHERQVLFLWPTKPSGSIAHLLIGGRPEGNETPEQAAIREVAEETGWRVTPISNIGFRHFFHLEPRSPETDRPYPDFIQPIFAAVAERFDPTILIPADQISAEFMDFETAENNTEIAQRPLLQRAAEVVWK
jgi:8-oxo-dGTP pyrophosphatase MutT (NUDIX family)